MNKSKILLLASLAVPIVPAITVSCYKDTKQVELKTEEKDDTDSSKKAEDKTKEIKQKLDQILVELEELKNQNNEERKKLIEEFQAQLVIFKEKIENEDSEEILKQIDEEYKKFKERITEVKDEKKHTLKWGHWNVLKFTGDKTKQEAKTKRLALLTFLEKFDILGLTEVGHEFGVQEMTKYLNLYDGSSNKYSYVISKKLKGDKFNPSSAEHVAIIYNTQKVAPEAFDNGEIGYSWQKTFDDGIKEKDAQYSRPPYGVKFKYNLKPAKKMTFVFSHFDGPGVKKGEGTYKETGIGIYEYRESKKLVDVLDYFDSIDGQQSNIFFGGDTNIKKGKQKIAFESMGNRYKFIFEDRDEHKTSLSTKPGKYSQPYDKLIYKTEFKISNPFIFDIWKTITDSYYIQKFEEQGIAIPKGTKISKPSVLSDHTYLGSEIVID
ncbi:hypothetical protein OF364_00545 [Mycoplasma enhydrae]|uniref:MnuA family membrane nuclease n=1 Tax=Mycoplasma enhydrae TaxID=2499220 RepID=UPI0021E7D3A4|nr:hypothetical protein [Mycoplasma enhydrae]MCV3753307.1 hypothetical protein [Mycoplasma enhydrae]